MAVLQMEQITVCAMRRDRKAILELLQLRGAVETADAQVESEYFCRDDTSTEREGFERDIKITREAAGLLDKYTGYKSSALAFLNGRQAVERSDVSDFYQKAASVLDIANEIIRCERVMAESMAEIARAQTQLDALAPWLTLPIAQSLTRTKKCAVFVGVIPRECGLAELLALLAENAPELGAVHAELVYSDKRQTCFYVVCLKRDSAEAERALRDIGFARPAAVSDVVPAERKKQLDDECAAAEKRISEAEERIKSFESSRPELLFLEDHLRMRAEKYAAISNLRQSRHVFVLNGYVLANRADGLKTELERDFCCSVQVSAPGDDDNVPVEVKNSKFAEPVESVLLSYSLPGKDDIDPTSVMSVFYYIMFGLMFSDAGYGIILAAACGIALLKFKNMDDGWKKNLRLFFWCGISTIFWGVVFSSYFGDVVDVVAGTFFKVEATIPPLWFLPLQDPMKLLMFCLGIGVIHLTAAYCLKAAACIKNKDYSGIIYDAVFPVATLYPLILLLMGSELFEGMAGFMLTLPPSATNICLAVSGISLTGVVLTGGRESRNWGKRLLKGLYAAYNVLAGWLSDILSYSRLLALGLATGVIASVMNQLGAMTGSGFFGAIVFVIVFVVGQSLNFGINVLGAYVHSNRLEFVEFFGKFYEGGGRKFAPLAINTKYYKVIEEDAQHG